MSPDAHPRPSLDQALASGLFDREWVSTQLGTPYADDASAWAAYLAADDCSPHPLFEGGWLDPAQPWQARGLDALSAYLTDERLRRTKSPHPMFDPARVVDAHPEAAAHPGGALGWWLARAAEDTPVPVPAGVPEASWGRYRAAAESAARRHAEGEPVRRSVRRTRTAPHDPPESAGSPLPAPVGTGDGPLVSVVLAVHNEAPRLRSAVDAVVAQTLGDWELVVVDDGSTDDTAAVLAGIAAFEPRVVRVDLPHAGLAAARNAGVERARGRYVAFPDTRHVWSPDFLSEMVGRLDARRWDLAHAAVRLQRSDGEWFRALPADRDQLLAHDHVSLATVVARRDRLVAAGGFDPTLEYAAGLDLVLRLVADADLHLVPRTLVNLDQTVDGQGDAAATARARGRAVVLERHLVDWSAADRGRGRDTLSVVLSTGLDLERTVRWVTRLMSRVADPNRVDLVVVGSRLPRHVEVPLATLLASYPEARLLSALAPLGPTVAANLGIAATTGEVVVLARTSVSPPRDGFSALTAAVTDTTVALAQPLLVDRPGLVASAGAAFGSGRPHPEPLLGGHPMRDALALGTGEVPAPLSPVVAARAETLVRLRGFDPRCGESLAEVELGIRARREGLGRTIVVTEGPMVLKAGQPMRLDSTAEAIEALQRLVPNPPDGSEQAWARAGFELVGRRWEEGTEQVDPLAVPALTPHAVLRPLRVEVREGPPRLRWAMDIAAPSGRRGQRWGDTHFARSLTDALERLGQRVALDTRDLRHRGTRDLDDVVLVLRGLDRAAPRPGRVNLEWVISHPDLVTAEELAGFDKVYAASTTWAAATSSATGIPVTPLLQCTDPRLFNPERAEPDSGPAVLFVGNSRDVFRRAVRSALAVGADIEVHGLDWERFLPPERISSRVVPNEELGILYASAGVVLNDHWDDMRRDGFLANRLFDVTACAGRLVTDDIPGLSATFGDAVRTFEDELEMGPLLADPVTSFPSREVRLDLARTVMREHSFDHRAEVLLDDAARIIAARRG